jgi:hypothetical protein
MIEQGVSTSSFDKFANRQEIAALAAKVDPTVETFYYSPRDSPYPPAIANLDAMWAGLATGKPTVNGYSGHTPFDWRELEDSNVGSGRKLRILEFVLEDWFEGEGAPVKTLQWIGGPDEWRHKEGPNARP